MLNACEATPESLKHVKITDLGDTHFVIGEDLSSNSFLKIRVLELDELLYKCSVEIKAIILGSCKF